MRGRDYDFEPMRQALRDLGELDSKQRMRFSTDAINLMIKHSGLKTRGALAREVKIRDVNLKLWFEDVSPTIRSLLRIRQATGVIFTFGTQNGHYPATVRGLAKALRKRKKTPTDLAIGSGVNVQNIYAFLNERQGSQTGLTAEIWTKFANALRCKFFVPTLREFEEADYRASFDPPSRKSPIRGRSRGHGKAIDHPSSGNRPTDP